jgi:rhomboid family GlyGly-CTERM serine protease
MIGKSLLAESAARRLPVASLLLVPLAAVLYTVPGIADWLQFDRQAILSGELWRVLTGHLVHWSADQLFWDGLACGFLGSLCEREDRGKFLRCVLVSALAIPLVLWFAAPQMATYRGLSGVDSTLFALAAIRIGREALFEKHWIKFGLTAIVAAGFALKIGYELVTGATLFVDSTAGGMTPVPLAHVVGALVGLVCGLSPRRVPVLNRFGSALRLPIGVVKALDSARERPGSL